MRVRGLKAISCPCFSPVEQAIDTRELVASS
jgi:hypothetical protein